MSTVVLILPAETYRAADFLHAARSLRVKAVVASQTGQAMEDSMGDDFIPVDPDYPEWSADRIVEYAADHPVDAVVAVDDQGVVVAALAGEALGLPHNPAKAAQATRDKRSMRAAFADTGIAQPDFRPVGEGDDVRPLAAQVGYPCVVKPVSESASRGVIRADDGTAAAAAAQRIREMLCADGDGTAPLLVEAFIAGDEVAVEGMLHDGELNVIAVFDKPDPLDGPYFEETLLVTPSRHSSAFQAEIIGLAQQAAAAVGLREGPVHAEIRIGGEGPRMLEIAARTIGGLCGRTLRFSLLGASLETLVLRAALGRPVHPQSGQFPASGVMMLPIAKEGRLRKVAGRRRALAVPGISGLEITIAPGRHVVPLPEGDRYLGFLFARGNSAAGVEDALRVAYAELDIVID
ncbi:MAG: ATP-grasp domain-containing protein [Acidimicrobiia bacterium]